MRIRQHSRNSIPVTKQVKLKNWHWKVTHEIDSPYQNWYETLPLFKKRHLAKDYSSSGLIVWLCLPISETKAIKKLNKNAMNNISSGV